MTRCPVCSSGGEGLLFAFYCSNRECQNFHKSQCQEIEQEGSEISDILRALWKAYGEGESESEFYVNFFAQGGKFTFTHDKDSNERIKSIWPAWLNKRHKARTGDSRPFYAKLA